MVWLVIVAFSGQLTHGLVSDCGIFWSTHPWSGLWLWYFLVNSPMVWFVIVAFSGQLTHGLVCDCGIFWSTHPWSGLSLWHFLVNSPIVWLVIVAFSGQLTHGLVCDCGIFWSTHPSSGLWLWQFLVNSHMVWFVIVAFSGQLTCFFNDLAYLALNFGYSYILYITESRQQWYWSDWFNAQEFKVIKGILQLLTAKHNWLVDR